MSDTPKTDAAACWPACDDSSDRFTKDGGYVSAEFARGLERENLALKNALKGTLFFVPIRTKARDYAEAAINNAPFDGA